MKNLLKKITSLALGAILLASCGAKSNEEAKTDAKSECKLIIGIVQIVDHPYSCMTNPWFLIRHKIGYLLLRLFYTQLSA